MLRVRKASFTSRFILCYCLTFISSGEVLIVERLVTCLGELSCSEEPSQGSLHFLNRLLSVQSRTAMFLQLVSVVVHTLYASSSKGAEFKVGIIDSVCELPTTRLIYFISCEKKKSEKKMKIFIYDLSSLTMPFLFCCCLSVTLPEKKQMMIRRKKRKRRIDIFHKSVWPL